MKIGFFGTPSHSAKLLATLIQEGFFISFVVANPDKPQRRKKILTPPPTKIIAEKHGIPVLQFPSIKNPTAIAKIRSFPADIHIVFAYGAIIPEPIFSAPRLGAINLHGSILPAYRGASPVQAALLHGESETGFSLQYITSGLDAGDVIASQTIAIDPEDNFQTLLDKISEQGIAEIIRLLKTNPTQPLPAQPQDNSRATYCSKIKAEDRILDLLQQDHRQIHNRVRALNPNQPPHITFRGKRINILKTLPLEEKKEDLPVNSFYRIDKKTLAIVCADHTLLSLQEVQPENKKPMQIIDFLNGFQPQTGDRIG